MHLMLEMYYVLKGKLPLTPIFAELAEQGLEVKHTSDISQAANYLISRNDMDLEEAEETRFQFEKYIEFYQNETWQPLAVEETGSKVLYEDYDIKIIYSFKIDLIVDDGRLIMPVDHKTQGRRDAPSSMENQFIGYCWALGRNYICINAIGFQKTLSPAERFQRYVLPISDARIAEWVKDTTYWAKYLAERLEKDHWPRSNNSCKGKYGCRFLPVCGSDPELRGWKLDSEFVQGPSWDVAKELEREKKGEQG